MHFLRSGVLAVVATLAAVAQADYSIDPDSVPLGTRQAWCANEKNTCPIICQQMQPQTTLINTCDPKTLTYGCLCGNNQRPNVSEYTLTLPYFVCQEWGNQCVKGCGGDNKCSAACREKHPCGATDPKKYTSTASTATPTATTTNANAIFTAPGSTGSASGDKKGAGVALQVGQAYGLVVVMAGFFAGFALL
ncbi:hypothetical protein JDV02_008997 [Purpureocillium takamizusanense]|uniref:DUF7707 domain-containing protein n=1 Tax=Purpureocillium takamizusanense TaxID=2060973 RepID=A0A9Q8VFU4_9HYPO|nr:uncharacterized protein JDV02_008997 [Purpureocillium takamizusanense]UNI23162.1 hypothetical protein JDV02_008997 [Purpureocillium takamizusanense]